MTSISTWINDVILEGSNAKEKGPVILQKGSISLYSHKKGRQYIYIYHWKRDYFQRHRRKVEIGSIITLNLRLRARGVVYMQGKIFDLYGVPEDLQISGKMRNNTIHVTIQNFFVFAIRRKSETSRKSIPAYGKKVEIMIPVWIFSCQDKSPDYHENATSPEVGILHIHFLYFLLFNQWFCNKTIKLWGKNLTTKSFLRHAIHVQDWWWK